MLPIALTRFFHDSRLVLESFSKDDNTLAIRIEKEIGPETGIICFRRVSFLSLPQCMAGERIRAKPLNQAGAEFWSRCLLAEDWFEADDILFEIESQDGGPCFIVAKSVDYEVVPAHSTSSSRDAT